MTDFLRTLRAFLVKDILREIRTAETLLAVAAFGFTIILVLSFALPAGGDQAAPRAAGALWIALLFAAQLGIARGIEVERAEGRLETILVTRVDGSTLFGIKAFSLFLHLAVAAGVLLLPFSVLFNIEPVVLARILPIVGLGLIGVALAGTLVAFVAAATRMREILMPVLFLTLFVPLLLAAVHGTAAAIVGVNTGIAIPVLLGFDLVIGGISILLAPALFDE